MCLYIYIYLTENIYVNYFRKFMHNYHALFSLKVYSIILDVITQKKQIHSHTRKHTHKQAL